MALGWSGLETESSFLASSWPGADLTHLSDTGTLVASGQSSSLDELLPLDLDEDGHLVLVIRVVLAAGQEGDHQHIHLQGGELARVEM